MSSVETVTVHYPARYLEGLFVWPLPLCWDADARQRHGDYDEDLWWISVDHEAIDPAAIVASTERAAVTCSACREWLHA